MGAVRGGPHHVVLGWLDAKMQGPARLAAGGSKGKMPTYLLVPRIWLKEFRGGRAVGIGVVPIVIFGFRPDKRGNIRGLLRCFRRADGRDFEP